MTENKNKEIEKLKMAKDILNAIRVNLWKEFYNTLEREYGRQKAIELSARAVVDAFRPLLETTMMNHEIENNAKGVAELVRMFHELEGLQGEIVESSKKRAVIRERICPSQNNLPGDWCKMVSPAVMDMVCELINPKLTSYHTSYLTAGDNYCEIIIELRD